MTQKWSHSDQPETFTFPGPSSAPEYDCRMSLNSALYTVHYECRKTETQRPFPFRDSIYRDGIEMAANRKTEPIGC